MPPSSQAALSSLTDFNNTRKSAQDITTQAQQQYGVPDSSARLSTIRGLVGNLQSSVNAVDPSVTGRTSGSFVTEGQRQALVNKERTPILGQLGEENTALGNEQQNFNTSSSLASQLASSVLSQDQTKYQGLLDQYNAAVASEKAAEDKRQFEATLAEQKRQADLTAKSAASGGAGSYNLAGLLGSGATASSPSTTPNVSPVEQEAYNDVAGRRGQTPEQIKSDFNATRVSANYGNQKDKLKLTYYYQLFPQYFQGSQNGGTNQSLPASVLANGSQLSY